MKNKDCDFLEDILNLIKKVNSDSRVPTSVKLEYRYKLKQLLDKHQN